MMQIIEKGSGLRYGTEFLIILYASTIFGPTAGFSRRFLPGLRWSAGGRSYQYKTAQTGAAHSPIGGSRPGQPPGRASNTRRAGPTAGPAPRTTGRRVQLPLAAPKVGARPGIPGPPRPGPAGHSGGQSALTGRDYSAGTSSTSTQNSGISSAPVSRYSIGIS